MRPHTNKQYHTHCRRHRKPALFTVDRPCLRAARRKQRAERMMPLEPGHCSNILPWLHVHSNAAVRAEFTSQIAHILCAYWSLLRIHSATIKPSNIYATTCTSGRLSFKSFSNSGTTPVLLCPNGIAHARCRWVRAVAELTGQVAVLRKSQ